MNVTVCGSSMGSDPDYKKAAEALGSGLPGTAHAGCTAAAISALMGIIADTVLENGGKVIAASFRDFLLHCEQGHEEGLHTWKWCTPCPPGRVG